MLMLINEYSFNNTINATPTEQGPPPPQDMRNITARNQIVNENREAIKRTDILGKEIR
jgi:hypothetical protein